MITEVILGLLAAGVILMAVTVYRLKKKLEDAIFLKREGDQIFFKDYQGETISKKIKIEL